MTSIQTSLQFPVKKKITFYKTKDPSTAVYSPKTTTPSRYQSTVKKIMVVSSSSEGESDSDTENSQISTDITRTPRRTRKASEAEFGGSPPKQKCINSPKTPSTLLNRLQLSPADEKTHLAPKKLFNDKYTNARNALHSSTSENLPGREAELAELGNFIKTHLETQSSGSLYVSGPPGTGKTACLSHIMQQEHLKNSFRIVYVNCTLMKSAGAIYAKIIQELGIGATKAGKTPKATIERHLASSHKMILLVLDEMDQLESKRQMILYSIFEWPSIPKSKLLLVGIANALDLTDRVLPRLQARCELKPKLLHFAPYSKQQLADIISDRLKQAQVSEVFSTVAVQLLAGKVAAISGDVRRALDISRRVIEHAESLKASVVLQPAVDNDGNGGQSKKQSPGGALRAVDLKEVLAVVNSVYGGSQNVEQDEDTFPLQQKILLCSLMLILNHAKNKDVTVNKLHMVYKKVCSKQKIQVMDISEFVGLCKLIETRGILRITEKKEVRLSKINLQWDQAELSTALQDKKLIADIIDDTSCL